MPLSDLRPLCVSMAGGESRKTFTQFSKRENVKTGQGDLVIKRANIGGDANLIIDVALIHEFGGNHMADVSLNGALRHAQPDKFLEHTRKSIPEKLPTLEGVTKGEWAACGQSVLRGHSSTRASIPLMSQCARSYDSVPRVPNLLWAERPEFHPRPEAHSLLRLSGPLPFPSQPLPSLVLYTCLCTLPVTSKLEGGLRA